jgi:outer membrane biosynthesis protein TonB
VAAALAPASATVVLLRAGCALPTPPLDPGGLARWVSGTDPVLAALGVVRVAALAVVAVQALAVLLSLTAAARQDRPLAGLARRLTLPPLRRLVDTAFGVGLGLAATTGPALAGEVPPAVPPTITMHAVETGAAPAAGTTAAAAPVVTMRLLEPPADEGPPAPPVPTVTMRALPDTPQAPPARPVPAPPPAGKARPVPAEPTPPAPPGAPTPAHADPAAPSGPAGTGAAAESPTAPPSGTPVPAPGRAGTWTIAPGEHLWHVASRTLAAAGRPTDDASVSAYLTRLVEANRQVLVVPGEPDLVFTGQVFVLPPV